MQRTGFKKNWHCFTTIGWQKKLLYNKSTCWSRSATIKSQSIKFIHNQPPVSMSIMYFYHIQGDIVGDIYTSLNKASQPPCCHPSDVIHGMFTYLYWPVVVLYDYSTKIRSPDYEWLQSVSNHELTQKSSRPSITNQARILWIDQGTKVHNFGALQSGENFWFLKEWFPISLVHRVADVMRFVAEGIVGVLVSAPRAG